MAYFIIHFTKKENGSFDLKTFQDCQKKKFLVELIPTDKQSIFDWP